MKAKNVIAACAALSMVVAGGGLPALAQKGPTSMSLKVGYFNLPLVKNLYAEASVSEQMRNSAQNEMQQFVSNANDQLQKAQKENKPKEEIEKLQRDLQLQIGAMQQALAILVQNQVNTATQRIGQAANAVAKEKGLDLVVDGTGVFAGNERVVNNGVDITDDVVKELNKTAAPRAAATGGGGATK